MYVRSLDVTQYDQVFEVFRAFKQDLGSLDRIIVNAGIGKGQPVGTGNFSREPADRGDELRRGPGAVRSRRRDLPRSRTPAIW